MNIKKMGAALAVAVTTMTLSGAALADGACESTSKQIKFVAKINDDTNANAGMFICISRGGSWPRAAIWQFKGKKGDGCEVHDKLGRLLYVVRTGDTPPPGGKNGKGRNYAKGAANDLDDGKFQSAIDQLQLFWDTIENDAKLSSSPTAASDADNWQAFAKQMQAEIQGCRTDL